MNRTAQALVLAAVGAFALRVGWTDEHLRFVNQWMGWPLVVSGIGLIVLAFTAVRARADADDHPTSRSAWALLVPLVLAFVVQPPALGGYVADRTVNQVPAGDLPDAAVAPLSKGSVNDLQVSNFVVLAADHGDVLADSPVRLTGFVTSDTDGWYVTRVAIRCCAADATAFRVRVDGDAGTPEDDQWVEVSGAWVEGTGSADGETPPAIAATDVRTVDEPKFPYE